MADINQLRKSLVEYVRNNGKFTNRQELLKRVADNKLKEFNITRDQLKEILDEILWPGEQRKGNVIFTKRKGSGEYMSVGKWDKLYFIKPGTWSEDKWNVFKHKPNESGYGGESELLIKNVNREYAHKYVLNKLDKTLPKPGKYTLVDKSRAKGGKAYITDIPLDEFVEKYGDYKKGLDTHLFETRPIVATEGLKRGVLVDGYILIESKKAAEDMLTKLIPKIPEPDKTSEFPKTENLYPDKKDLIHEWEVIGIRSLGDQDVVAILTNGHGDIMAIDTNKLALANKYLPGAKLMSSKITYSGDNTSAATTLAFVVNGHIKGLVMPMFIQIPQNMKEYAQTKATGIVAPEEYKPKKITKQVKKQVIAEGENYTFAELMEIHQSRSPQAKAADEARKHSKVIDIDDVEGVKRWIKDPGSKDIKGIDTPKKTKKTRSKSSRTKTRSKSPTIVKSIRRR